MLDELVGKNEVGAAHRRGWDIDDIVGDAALVKRELDARRERADPVPIEREVGGGLTARVLTRTAARSRFRRALRRRDLGRRR